MAQSCGQCPALRARIAQLEGVVAQQQRTIAYLRNLLAHLVGAVRATVEFIEQEIQQPTMQRRQMIGALHARLTYTIDLAEGRVRL